MKILKKRLIDYANALVFGITIIGFNIISIYKIPTSIQIIGSLLLGGIYFFLTYQNSEKIRVFDESSKEFYEYFFSWYKKEGKLFIYCTDLNWLDNDRDALGQKAIHAIRQKGKDAHVFLKDVSGPIVKNLKELNVNIYLIERDLITENRFSMIIHEGLHKIIIRNKNEDGDDKKIAFIETDNNKDPYLLSLAMDLLESSTQGFSF